MIPGIMAFLGLFALSAGCAAIAWVLALQLAPESNRKGVLRWLIPWSLKGLIAPLVVWGLMNVGWSWKLQPFMPQIQVAKNSGQGWFSEFAIVLGSGTLLVSSYWTGLTLGWLIYTTAKGAGDESRKDFKGLFWTCILGLGIPALIVVLVGGLPTVGLATTIILAPMGGYGAALLRPRKTPPMYARAIARIKFGKYSEAEWEIIHELEKAEDDFEGWIMLAELYASQFGDLAEAERTIKEICDQPKLTPSQLSIALHKLADWHLKFAQNPDAARRALEMIVGRLRGTHLARMAQLRINQLPATAEALQEQRSGKPIPLPALGEHFDEMPNTTVTREKAKRAAHEANACVERLNVNPNDVDAREKLARILAEQLGQVDQAIEQLMLLLNMPQQPDNRIAEWLSLVAAWHIRFRKDLSAGRRTLERLIKELPDTPQAFAARYRLKTISDQPSES